MVSLSVPAGAICLRSPRAGAGPGQVVARLGLVVAREAVVRDRLPGRRVRHERAPARPDAGIAVEGAHPHAHLRGVARIAAEELGAALAAEELPEAAVGMAPCLDEIL